MFYQSAHVLCNTEQGKDTKELKATMANGSHILLCTKYRIMKLSNCLNLCTLQGWPIFFPCPPVPYLHTNGLMDRQEARQIVPSSFCWNTQKWNNGKLLKHQPLFSGTGPCFACRKSLVWSLHLQLKGSLVAMTSFSLSPQSIVFEFRSSYSQCSALTITPFPWMPQTQHQCTGWAERVAMCRGLIREVYGHGALSRTASPSIALQLSHNPAT